MQFIIKLIWFIITITISIPTLTFSHDVDYILGKKSSHHEILPEAKPLGNHGYRYVINFNDQVTFRWNVAKGEQGPLDMELQGKINQGWMAVGICEPLLRDIMSREMDGCDVILAYNGMRTKTKNDSTRVLGPVIYNYYTEGNNLIEVTKTPKNEEFFTRTYSQELEKVPHADPDSTIVKFVSVQNNRELHFKRPVLLIYAINNSTVVKEDPRSGKPILSTIFHCLPGQRGHTSQITNMYQPEITWKVNGGEKRKPIEIGFATLEQQTNLARIANQFLFFAIQFYLLG